MRTFRAMRRGYYYHPSGVNKILIGICFLRARMY